MRKSMNTPTHACQKDGEGPPNQALIVSFAESKTLMSDTRWNITLRHVHFAAREEDK